jgi:hypothetical protein
MSFADRVSRRLLRPVVCESLQRVGGAHDGGYVVPVDAIQRASVLLSFGLATNWTFERAAATLNPQLRIEAYDPSVTKGTFVSLGLRAAVSVPLRLIALSPRGARSSARKTALSIDYFRFFSGNRRHHQQRVWYNTDDGSADIAKVIDGTGMTTPLSIFAKIDIEGTEYRIIPAIRERAALFTALVIEFHDIDICADLFNLQMESLREEFEVVHVHGNNHGDLNIDHTFPLSLEVTFLNKRMMLGPRVPYDGPLPRPDLDAPNDTRKPDYSIDLSQPDPPLT